MKTFLSLDFQFRVLQIVEIEKWKVTYLFQMTDRIQRIKLIYFGPETNERSSFEERSPDRRLWSRDRSVIHSIWIRAFDFGRAQNSNLAQIFRRESRLAQNCLYQAALYYSAYSVAWFLWRDFNFDPRKNIQYISKSTVQLSILKNVFYFLFVYKYHVKGWNC